ncbi:MAG: phage major capsid protein [Massilimicrobiota timonensis]
MKNKTVNKEIQQKALDLLQNSEDKSQAILEAISLINESQNEELIKQLQHESEEYEADRNLSAKLGLRTNFSTNEKEFYDKLIANQSITFTQSDIIPTEIVDRTLDDVKKASSTLKLVRMAPASVKKWIVASKTGAAAWTGLTDSLTKELTAEIKSLNIEINKLHVLLVIPKAVRELSLPFVDKYFSAILAEAMHDGLVDGYLNGDGKTGPIGIFKKIEESETDGTKKAKTVDSKLTGFTPKQLSPVKKFLSNDGKRAVPILYLIANPVDVYEYVEPALYFLTPNGYVCTSKTKIEVIEEPMCATGKAIFTIEDAYVMGMSGININEYDQTKALDDADLIIAKAYANGRAIDENTAYPFDVTKLKEYVMPVNTIATNTTTDNTEETE